MEDYRLIPLSGKRGIGKYAKVSVDDYDMLMKHTWHVTKDGYPRATITFSRGHKKPTKMHHVLVQLHSGLEVDHINRDKLDNRRSNLRLVTRRENLLNSDNPIALRLLGERVKGSRGQRAAGWRNGVRYAMHWCRTYKKWRGSVHFEDRKPIYAGSHLRKLALWARCEEIARQIHRKGGPNPRISGRGHPSRYTGP